MDVFWDFIWEGFVSKSVSTNACDADALVLIHGNAFHEMIFWWLLWLLMQHNIELIPIVQMWSYQGFVNSQKTGT